MADISEVDVKLVDIDDGTEISNSSIVLNDDGEFQLNGHTYEVVKKEIQIVETETEVIVHAKETRSSSPIDAEFARLMRRQQRKLIAAQRKPIPSETNSTSVILGSYNLPPALSPALSPKLTADPPKFSNSYPVSNLVKPAVHQQPIEPTSPEPVNEELAKPVVVLRKDYAQSFLNLINSNENEDGIVWTPIPKMEPQNDELLNGHGSDDTVDRKSIIENKDTTKEFLMGKMLESIEQEEIKNSSLTRGNSYLNLLNMTNGDAHQNGSNYHRSNSKQPSEIEKPILKKTELLKNEKTKILYNGVTQNEKPEIYNSESMQLVSARPCFVVDNEFPTKVSEPGAKKTTAQKSTEAMIAKEIEDMKLREAELLQSRSGVLQLPSSPAEVEVPILNFLAASTCSSSPSVFVVDEVVDIKVNKLPDILANPPITPPAFAPLPPPTVAPPRPPTVAPPPPPTIAPPIPSVSLSTHPKVGPLSPIFVSAPTIQIPRPISPLMDNLTPAPLSPALSDSVRSLKVTQERIKVRPLTNDSDDEDSNPRYKFHKETAVEREVRLAMQKEEELRKEKQQMLQKTSVVAEKQVVPEHKSVIKLESQFVVVSQPDFTTAETAPVVAKVKQLPPTKLVLSGPSSIVSSYADNSISHAKSNGEIPKFSKPKEVKEIIVKAVSKQTNAECHSYQNDNVPSSAPPSLKAFNYKNIDPISNSKQPSIGSDRLLGTGTPTNRNLTRGIMAQFFRNSGKQNVFVPKTTIPAVQPAYVASTNGDAKSNGTNGVHVSTTDNEVENQNPKLHTKIQYRRSLSSVENKILEELKEMQGREKELRAERSRFVDHIETSINEEHDVKFNGQAYNNLVETPTGAWGIFALINSGSNGQSEA